MPAPEMASRAARTSAQPNDADPPPHLELIRMVTAIWPARALYAAAKLNLGDLIGDEPQSVETLARATATHAPSLHRLLRALASIGLLRESSPGCFVLTKLGAALKTNAPGAARATVLTLGGDWQWRAWEGILHSLRTGQPSLREAYGMALFEYLSANPEESARFNEAMVGMHGADGRAIADAYDFSSFRTVVDLGGGTGTLLTAILHAHGHLRGLLFELAETVPQARRLIDACGLAGRCDVIAGDFFKEVPHGHDAYLLAHVLHDWTDEQALAVLRNCRTAMPPHGRLLILESVLPSGDTPHPGKMMDLLMLTVTGGVERTAPQFAKLLGSAGFDLTRLIPTATDQTILEAICPSEQTCQSKG